MTGTKGPAAVSGKPYDPHMAITCVPDAAAEANERIREFMAARSGRPLWADEAEEYEQLLATWAAAQMTA